MDYKDFSSINSVDTLYGFLEEKKLTHTKYCYYSAIKGIDSILEKQFFWLSSAYLVNDRKESNTENEFFLCLSATDSENIPMWYLYGGIDGQGARITFKKSLLKRWLSDIEKKSIVYLVKYKDSNYDEILEKEPLEYSVRCSDVLYLSSYEDDNSCRIKYNNHSNFLFAKEKYQELCERFKGAVKAVPWFYEKEFRIIVTVKNSIAELIKRDNCYKVVLSFPDDIMSDLDIMTCPEQTEDIDTSVLKGFSQYLQKKIHKSRYTGEIEMGLRKRMCDYCNRNNPDDEKIAMHI